MSDADGLVGSVLQGQHGRYYVAAPIGEGGQGFVFRASYDDPEGFPVVVKVLRPDAVTRSSLERFRQEAEILRSLSQAQPSPYIVRFYDHGEASVPTVTVAGHGYAQVPFMAMELVDGQQLGSVLIDAAKVNAPLPLPRVRRIAREIARALSIVHAHGVVHRDLKPSNILLWQDGQREVAKVTDFGIVKVAHAQLTSTEALVGVSVSYAPPEQYEPGNARVGPATDLFSYAAVVYEMLTLSQAFPSPTGSPFEALQAMMGPRPSLLAAQARLNPTLRNRPDLLVRIDTLLQQAFDPDPSRRPQSILALADPLVSLLREPDEGAINSEQQTAKLLGNQPQVAHEGPFRVRGMSSTLSQLRPATPPTDVVAIVPIVSTPASPFGPPSQEIRASVTPPRTESRTAFQVSAVGSRGVQLTDAVVDPAGRVFSVGSAGLVVFAAGAFSAIPSPPGFGPQEVLGLAWLATDQLAVCGARGLCAFLRQGVWDLRVYAEPDVTFHALAEANGRLVLVGERPQRGHGVVAELTQDGFSRVFDPYDLGALRSVAAGNLGQAVAVGDRGALVRVDGQGLAKIVTDCTGNLRSIAAQPADLPQNQAFFAVGTGGYALHILGTNVQIERVSTTRDLTFVGTAHDTMWAVGASGRLLRRQPDASWQRVAGIDGEPDLFRLFPAKDRGLTLLGTDGALWTSTDTR